MIGTTVGFDAQIGSGFAIARGNSILCFFPRRDDAPFRVFFCSAFPTPGLEVNGALCD